MSLLKTLATLFRTPKARTRSRPRTALRLERFEDRTVPSSTINVWNGDDDGDLWSDPANWSLGRTPIATDTLYFGINYDEETNQAVGTNTDSVNDIPNLTVDRILGSPEFTATVTIESGNVLTVNNNFIAYGNWVMEAGAVVDVNLMFEIMESLTTYGASPAAPTAISAEGLAIYFDATWTVLSQQWQGTTAVTAQVVHAGTVTLLPPSYFNSNTLSVTLGYELLSTGQLNIGFNSELKYSGNNSLDAQGEISLVSGILDVTGSPSLELNGGTMVVQYAGIVEGNFGNVAGTVRFADPYSDLNIYGDYETLAGTIEINILNAASNTVVVHGTMTFHSMTGNLLNVISYNGSKIAYGPLWIVVSAEARVGSFDSISLPERPGPRPGAPDWIHGWVWNFPAQMWEYQLT